MKESDNDATWCFTSEKSQAVTKKNKKNIFETYVLRTQNLRNTKQDSYKTDHKVSSLCFSIVVAIIFFFILKHLEFFWVGPVAQSV
jgi:hypothetical protein